ncbi:MAG TPA: hypothetical protein VNO43_17295 [Candidatus Eisenbacteria bacterium]|nr:hypothetical protein [Candidatus Eisenbacteria bacterium]
MAKPNYASDLRALGQALEILRVERFEIEPDGKSYLVQVTTERPGGRYGFGPNSEKTLRYIWAGTAAERDDSIDVHLLYAMAKTLDLHYSPEDVARLEQEWRAQRAGLRASADPARLSELLRTAGGYVESKEATLLSMRRHGSAVTIRYQTKSGEDREETLEDVDLYAESLHMISQRKNYVGPH